MRDEHLCCIIGYNVVPLQDGVPQFPRTMLYR